MRALIALVVLVSICGSSVAHARTRHHKRTHHARMKHHKKHRASVSRHHSPEL
jgi:hypothetical protein